ncbi:hypothetical protein GGR57DRAFT_489996 [Xylariaceae sp. FL1272]|nr:hypothetical protein GGR57DRAFT_489996 [Xylariaceae sp. FL1272]
MFRLQSQRVYEGSKWYPDGGGLAFLETPGDYREDELASHELLRGYLYDDDVEEWVQLNTKLGSRSPPAIRILFCDRVGWKPFGFAISSKSYCIIEEHFGFGSQVLPLLSSNAGQHSCSLEYGGKESSLESLEFTVKWPQMYQIGNCGFVLRYDFNTKSTQCFVHGWNVVTETQAVPLGDTFIPVFQQVVSRVAPARSFWSHPLFLPTVFLAEHISRAEHFRGWLSKETILLEKKLGITKTATLSWKEVQTFESIQRLMADRQARVKLTTDLSSRITDATNFLTVLEWIIRHCQYLEKYKNVIQGINPHTSKNEHRELEEYLEYLANDVQTMVTNVQSIKARLELQLDVLYNFVAQVDNDLNLRMAYRTGIDGTAMKTLAYVTAVFLPPTFVAIVFSMSMFDWQASVGKDETRVVVPDVWIFFVVSVPLTLVVLVLWRWWLKYEKSALRKEYSIK